MKAICMISSLLVVGSSVFAQTTSAIRFELRPFAGAYIPTGKLADDYKSGMNLGTQAAVELSPRVHLLVTGSWMHGHNKFVGMNNDHTHLWQYDAGGEFTPAELAAGTWMFRPFFGVGAGARTYDFKHAGMASSTQVASYAAIGHEVLRGAFAIRCEARDYVSRYVSPVTRATSNRNDLAFSFGVAFHLASITRP